MARCEVLEQSRWQVLMLLSCVMAVGTGERVQKLPPWLPARIAAGILVMTVKWS